MSYKRHYFAAWSGVAFIVLFGVGWAWLGGMVPPPSPAASADQIAQFFRADTISILFGMLVIMIGVALLVPFFALMSLQMARIEGRWPLCALICAIAAAINIVYFVLPVLFWVAAAFRPEQSPEVIRLFNDIAWIIILWPFSTTVLQNILFSLVVLSDKRETPLFPRWVAYLTMLVAFLILPGGLLIFFKSGAFAWNGILAFWVVAMAYLPWVCVMSWALSNSVKVVELEEAGGTR